MPQVSVIIPCYNHGAYLDDAVQSVLDQTFDDFEIIIVNDGSTDQDTNKILNNYNRQKTKVLHTDNQGLPSARNNGIKISKGEYILPLDADDRIGKTYLEDAVQILDNQPDIGIVYCDAEFFGDKTGKWELPDYSLQDILVLNMIFCCAMFRRIDWENVGGYNLNMVYGNEDWDFWLSLLALGRKVHKIEKVLFFYRFNKNSMIQNLGRERKKAVQTLSQGYFNHKQFYESHIGLIFDKILTNTEQINKYKSETEYLNTTIEYLNIEKENMTSKIEYLNDLIRILRESWRFKIGSIIVNTLKAPLNLIKRN
jgi:glycosyltransferase involved in cell wall biosynthesis